jgi:hypothetical protein
MVDGKKSGMHQKTCRINCESRKGATWSVGSGPGSIKRYHVLAVRVGRCTHGQKRSGMHQKISRTFCESRKGDTRLAGSDLACINRHHVLAMRVGRRRHGEREVIWHASTDITYLL